MIDDEGLDDPTRRLRQRATSMLLGVLARIRRKVEELTVMREGIERKALSDRDFDVGWDRWTDASMLGRVLMSELHISLRRPMDHFPSMLVLDVRERCFDGR